MKRICVIGDSHVAAIKVGWQSIAAEYSHLDLTFFAAGGSELDALVVLDGRLSASSPKLQKLLRLTSGGKAFIGSRYHRYIVCGLGMGIMKGLLLYREKTAQEASALISDEALLDSFCELYQGVLAIETISKLREITDREVVTIATPFPGIKRLAKSEGSTFDNSDAFRCADLFAETCRRLSATVGARFLSQPSETLGPNRISTLEDYCSNAVRLGNGPDDNIHKNAAYGAIVLRAALSV